VIVQAISTHVTKTGTPIAQVAATTFRKSYRAFHLVNKPTNAFLKRQDDVLFLDALSLQRQGFVTLEWSLLADCDDNTDTAVKHKYKLAVPGDDADEIITRRRVLENQLRQLRAVGDILPLVDHEDHTGREQSNALENYSWCQKWIPRIEAAMKSHQAQQRWPPARIRMRR